MPKILDEADSAGRKAIPLKTGCFDYFADALCYVAMVSKWGNDKHNPGQPLFWNREKSSDEADSIARHLMETGGLDKESGLPSSAHNAWRALAACQKDLEAMGLAYPPPGARWPSKEPK